MERPHQRPHWFDRLKRFADRSWYAPLVGLLAAADQFIVLVPIETLMIPTVLVRPKRWLSTGLYVGFGCAVGALGLATVAELYGMGLLEHWTPNVVHSSSWVEMTRWIASKGSWALFLISLSPLPQQPAIAIAGLSHLPVLHIFLAVWTGRSIKYGAVAYLASHAPRLLAKFLPSFKKTQKEK